MKEFIRKNLPVIFNKLKNYYHKSWYYKAQNSRNKILLKEWGENRLIEDLKIIKEVFNDQWIVCNGPFRGLKYICPPSDSEFGRFLPKLLGSYEEPIQEWIEKCIARKYTTVINIGCAEGYYAAGLATRLPDSSIIAFDIDQAALNVAIKLKQANNLSNLDLRRMCNNMELNTICKKDTLILCDIEGAERDLIDPVIIPNLRMTDMIIESHDFIVQDITEQLIKRFEKTHKIQIIIDYPSRINRYLTPQKISLELFDRITNESRQPGTRFLFMQSLSN